MRYLTGILAVVVMGCFTGGDGDGVSPGLSGTWRMDFETSYHYLVIQDSAFRIYAHDKDSANPYPSRPGILSIKGDSLVATFTHFSNGRVCGSEPDDKCQWAILLYKKDRIEFVYSFDLQKQVTPPQVYKKVE